MRGRAIFLNITTEWWGQGNDVSVGILTNFTSVLNGDVSVKLRVLFCLQPEAWWISNFLQSRTNINKWCCVRPYRFTWTGVLLAFSWNKKMALNIFNSNFLSQIEILWLVPQDRFAAKHRSRKKQNKTKQINKTAVPGDYFVFCNRMLCTKIVAKCLCVLLMVYFTCRSEIIHDFNAEQDPIAMSKSFLNASVYLPTTHNLALCLLPVT